jgi:hypothetical protein
LGVGVRGGGSVTLCARAHTRTRPVEPNAEASGERAGLEFEGPGQKRWRVRNAG